MFDGRDRLAYGRIRSGVRVLASGAGVFAEAPRGQVVARLHGLRHRPVTATVHAGCRLLATILRLVSVERR